MIFSAVGGITSPIQVNQASKPEEVQLVDNSSKKETIKQKISIEQYVRDYFSDIPILTHVAYCESRFRQYDKDGTVFRGATNNQDVGVMQINEHYHLDTAEEGNYNIYSVEGNTAYARKLYEKFGTLPWNSSRACWGRYVSQSQVATNDISNQLAQAN